MTDLDPEKLLQKYPEPVRQLAESLRALIQQIDPELTERAYSGWQAIGYRHPRAGYLCAVFLFPDMVKLGFEYGALLRDEESRLSSGPSQGTRVRYLEVRTPADIDKAAIQAFVLESISLRMK
jgi:hypothetical protein